nr:hypothetical protein [Vibrio maerlii]
MPDTYCKACKRVTAHKAVMKRCMTQEVGNSVFTKLQSFTQFMSLFANGEHYYKMEPQFYCRVCNQHSKDEQLSQLVLKRQTHLA